MHLFIAFEWMTQEYTPTGGPRPTEAGGGDGATEGPGGATEDGGPDGGNGVTEAGGPDGGVTEDGGE